MPLLGVVFNAPETADDSTGTNADALRRLDPTVRIASLPRLDAIATAADHLGPVAEWLEV